MTQAAPDTLRFLLTAPLVQSGEGATRAIDDRVWEPMPRLRERPALLQGPIAHLESTSASLYQSRFESSPDLLRHERSPQLPPTILLFDGGHGGNALPYQVMVGRAELRRAMRNITVFLAEVEMPTDHRCENIGELEILLSLTVQAMLSFHGDLGTAGLSVGFETRWVARCLQIDGIEDLSGPPLPELWLHDSEAADSAVEVLRHDGDVLAGWGNSIILEPPDAAAPTRLAVRDGTVDAQILWNLLETIDGKLQKISLDEGIPLKAALLELEGLEEKRLTLHYAFDELDSRIQGPRRRVAEALLSTWAFRARLRTVDERFADVRSRLTISSARGKESYQSIVELLLVFIGVLAVSDVFLSAAQLAFSGGVDSVPGDASASRWLILAALREGDVDFLMIIAGLLSMIILSMLLMIRFVTGSTLRHRLRMHRARRRSDREAR